MKKGIIFTLVVLIFLSVFFLGIVLDLSYNERQKSAVIESRIISMNQFIKDTDQDIKRGLYIASFRALLSLNQNVVDNGVYTSDLDSSFTEIMTQGSLNSNQLSLMAGQDLFSWITKISQLAAKKNLLVSYNINDVILTQEDPWNILIKINITSNISDTSNLARWYRTTIINTSVSIINFEDPLYAIESNNQLVNTIIKTNITVFTSGGDTTNLIIHNLNQFYMYSDSAPDFLMRLQGNLSSSSCCGIESLVYLPNIVDNTYIYNKSVVDYIYWSGSDPESYTIQNMPIWFRIDNQSNHLDEYDVENILS